MSGMSLELGDQLSEMLLCPALATQLLLYSLVTLACIGPPRIRERGLRPTLRYKVTDEGSKCSQRCAPGQYESRGAGLGGQEGVRESFPLARKMRRVERQGCSWAESQTAARLPGKLEVVERVRGCEEG